MDRGLERLRGDDRARRPAAASSAADQSHRPAQDAAHTLDPAGLPDYVDVLYRAAYALCGSRHDAEDLVQETFAQVLKRPRLVRRDHELGYLLRALRKTYYNRHRASKRRPPVMLVEDTVGANRASTPTRSCKRSPAHRPSVETP